MIPSPIIALQVDGSPEQVQPETIAHEEHPSVVTALLSSQASEPLTSPSGQIVVQVEGVPVQLQPDSY